jgi:hypothetical protein
MAPLSMSPAFSFLSGELSERSLSRDSSFTRLSGVPFVFQNQVFSQALLDFLVIAAWAKLVGTAVSWQVMTPALFTNTSNTTLWAGKRPFSLHFVNRITVLLRSLVLLMVLSYTCLYAIKLSFLLFFHRLGTKNKGERI